MRGLGRSETQFGWKDNMVYCRGDRDCVTVPSPWAIKHGKFRTYYVTGVVFLSLICAFVLASGLTATITCVGYVQPVAMFLMIIYLILITPSKHLTKEFRKQTPKLKNLYNGTYAAEFVLFCAYFSFGMTGTVLSEDCYYYDGLVEGFDASAMVLGVAFVVVGSVSLHIQKKLAKKYRKKLNSGNADVGADEILSSLPLDGSSSGEMSHGKRSNKAVQTDICLGRRGMIDMFGSGSIGQPTVVYRQSAQGMARPILDGVGGAEYLSQGGYGVSSQQCQRVIDVSGMNLYGAPSGNTVMLGEQRAADNRESNQNGAGQGGSFVQ